MSAQESLGRHDPAALRQSLRKQRERGCSIYIAAAELRTAGVDPDGPPPLYRLWAGERGRFVVTLYPR
jgi:hypothetical protein